MRAIPPAEKKENMQTQTQTAPGTSAGDTYEPTAADLEDIRLEQEWRKMMDERDAKIASLREKMREHKGTDPEAYFTAKDALQSILEEGIDRSDAALLVAIEPIWDGTARAKSGGLIYLLQKKEKGWDLLIEKNEMLLGDYTLAMIDDDLSEPAARYWAEEVIRFVEEEPEEAEQEILDLGQPDVEEIWVWNSGRYNLYDLGGGKYSLREKCGPDDSMEIEEIKAGSDAEAIAVGASMVAADAAAELESERKHEEQQYLGEAERDAAFEELSK